jgi:hypothetical protein
MSKPLRKKRAAVSGLLIFTVGCYQHLSTGVNTPLAVGQDVRVLVTATEAERLRLSDLLPGSGMTVEAKVVGSDPSAVGVEVPIGAAGRSPFGERDLVQRIAIQRDGIERLEFRQLDKSRTYIAGAGFGVALVFFVVAAFSGSGSGGGIAPEEGGTKGGP